MNRDILFKAKRIDNREWIEGYYVKFYSNGECEPNYMIFAIDEANKTSQTYSVDPSTVCRCTGLTDKNGRKIFKGDIVKHYNNDFNPSQFDTGTIMWNDKVCQFQRSSNSDNGFYDINNICVYEVIGNIFDNSESSKGVQDEHWRTGKGIKGISRLLLWRN